MTIGKDLAWRLTILLDAALPLLAAEAAREKRKEAGKTLRQTTAQSRFVAAEKAVKEASGILGVEP